MRNDLPSSLTAYPISSRTLDGVGAPITFEVFVYDDRYSVPTLHLIAAQDASAAKSAAAQLLAACAHHLGVEVCCGAEQIVEIGACPARTPTGEALPLALREASFG